MEIRKNKQKKAEQLAEKKRRMLNEKLEYQKEKDPISLGTHEEGIQFLIENPIYFAMEWLEVGVMLRAVGMRMAFFVRRYVSAASSRWAAASSRLA